MAEVAWVYIMTNKRNTVLYTGVTNNLVRRVYEHQEKKIPGFTQQYNVTKLVYYESHMTFFDAIDREKLIKKKSRRGKIRLIETMNPQWADLANQLDGDTQPVENLAEIPDALRAGDDEGAQPH
jgi:putative endonuclease